MKVLTFPFKILILPCKFVMGFVGVLFAACINVMLTFLLVQWLQGHWNFMHGVNDPALLGMSTANILELMAFIFSIVAAYDE